MKQDKYLGLILVAFSGLMYWQAELLPPAMFGTLGAGAFPKLIFVLLGLGGAGIFIQAVISQRKLALKTASETEAVSTDIEKKPSGFSWVKYKFVFIGFIFFMVYVGLMYYLGYVISTLIFLPSLMWILGPKTKQSMLIVAVVSLGLTFFMQYSFVHVLKVFLPAGTLF